MMKSRSIGNVLRAKAYFSFIHGILASLAFGNDG